MTQSDAQLDEQRGVSPIADFDDHRWPLVLIVLAVAGGVAWMLDLPTADFNDPRIVENGWVRVGGVALLVGVLVWGVTRLRSRIGYRLQLCLVLSLLFHIALVSYLREHHLTVQAQREQLAQQAEERQENMIVDYRWQHAEPPPGQQAFEIPVETALPENGPKGTDAPRVVAMPAVRPSQEFLQTGVSAVVAAAHGEAAEGRQREEPVSETPAALPLRRTVASASLAGQADLDEPQPVVQASWNEPEPSAIAVAAEVAAPRRRDEGPPVEIAAVQFAGTLDSDREPLVSVPGRRVAPESEVAYAIDRRTVLQRSPALWTLDGKALEPAEAFRHRQPGVRTQVVQEHGGDAATERAVELGLGFLARSQFPDGRWCLDRFPAIPDVAPSAYAPGQMQCDTAATGLSLLAFLGAGHTHLEGSHRGTVRRGLEWLLRNQQPSGQLFTRETDATLPARSYGHGIAAIALCEAYGMTHDAGLRGPAQRAIGYILEAQDPQRGGWRYTKPDDAPIWYKESDTSVSGWMLMALKSAQMAGLDVPTHALDRVSQWLDVAQAEGGSRYVYNPYALSTPPQAQGRLPNRAMTAEGLLMRLYLGTPREHPAIVAGAEYLKANLPELGTADQSQRDSYYWYYATQVMFQMQGDCWTRWNASLRAVLEPSQVTDGPLAGSWHPQSTSPDRWAHAGGRLYVTALDVLMLEVYYRHLPLFRNVSWDRTEKK